MELSRSFRGLTEKVLRNTLSHGLSDSRCYPDHPLCPRLCPRPGAARSHFIFADFYPWVLHRLFPASGIRAVWPTVPPGVTVRGPGSQRSLAAVARGEDRGGKGLRPLETGLVSHPGLGALPSRVTSRRTILNGRCPLHVGTTLYSV